MSFESLGLPAALARAVADSGYTQPTDVQTRARAAGRPKDSKLIDDFL
jgi:superfamily II DNA/RNA helicase